MTWNWSSLKDILYPGIQFNNLILTSQFQEKITNQFSCPHINNLTFLCTIICLLQFLPFQLQLIRPMIHVAKNSKMSGCEIRHGPENYQKDVHMTYLFLFINLPSLIIGAFGFHQLRPEQKICKLLLEVGCRIKQCTMDINHNNSSISRSCVLLYICLQTFAHWAIKRFRNGGCHALAWLSRCK